MAQYLLNNDIAIRSYNNVLCAVYRRGEGKVHAVSRQEFAVLLSCDGKEQLREDEILLGLLDKGIIRRKKGEDDKLEYWQYHKFCDNDVTPFMNLEITQHCDCNCMHCFNATGSEVPKEQMSLEQISHLLDKAYECGIFHLTITGGEPLIRKDFLNIVDAISDRGMSIVELNTNGSFLTKEILDHLTERGNRPKLKISFDGIGFHDEMRGKSGMEKRALEAIELAASEGFNVMVQMNVNTRNEECILPSLQLMEKLGAGQTRIIRTIETPRWAELHENESLGWKEYYELCILLLQRYCSKEHTMALNLWQFAVADPEQKLFFRTYELFGSKGYRDSAPSCRGTRGMPAIGANGNIYPCMQMSGYFELNGIKLGNVFDSDLQKLLQSGKYHDAAYLTVGERVKKNEKCAGCAYLQKCGGGCPALGLLYTGRYAGEDISKCILFENGYDKEAERIMAELGYAF